MQISCTMFGTEAHGWVFTCGRRTGSQPTPALWSAWIPDFNPNHRRNDNKLPHEFHEDFVYIIAAIFSKVNRKCKNFKQRLLRNQHDISFIFNTEQGNLRINLGCAKSFREAGASLCRSYLRLEKIIISSNVKNPLDVDRNFLFYGKFNKYI